MALHPPSPSAPAVPGSSTSRAEEALVRQHLPLVEHEVATVLRRLPSHVQRDDLVSAGRLALLLAARGYDPEHGVPFDRYAARRITGALLDELRAVDWASRSLRRRAREQDAAAAALTLRLGRVATTDEIAASLGVPSAEVTGTQADVHRSVVLSWQAVVAVTGEEPAHAGAEPSPEALLVARERDAYLHDAVAELPDRLRRVVTALYFDEQPLAAVALELGVTESRVSQIRTEALALLREGLAAPLAVGTPPVDVPVQGCVARRRAAYRSAVAERSTWQSRLGVPAPAAALVPDPV